VYPFFLRAALLMGLAVHCVGNPLKASELAIQGGSSTGGSSTMVVGQAGGLTLLSATGAWQDRVRVVTSFGVDLDCSIGELSTLPNWVLWPLERTSSTKLRDGQTRVMLRSPCTPWHWAGGAVELRRGRATIDSDPIYLWAY
jgi:hypothetical protein